MAIGIGCGLASEVILRTGVTLGQGLALTMFFRTGVTYVSARAYKATRCQAAVFSVVSVLMDGMLPFFVLPFINTRREFALARILCKTTSYGVGVLATKFFCERRIKWKEAVASTAISNFAATFVLCVLNEFIPIANA
ncbi:MAG TPA: hypothetical protein VFU89_03095 [Rhabdochlamydiaceae bacterium]|nr:hypothetical protein [Rhabdochlamydiaceae bacterium]